MILLPLLLVALVIGGVFAARLLLSAEFVKARLAEAVRRETGRTLHIGDAAVSLWPRLAVRLKDVRLSDPPRMNGGRGTFLQVGRVDMAVALEPLLRRRLDVRRVDLHAPIVNLRIDEAGNANWDFSPPPRDGDGEENGAGADTGAKDGAKGGSGNDAGGAAVTGMFAGIRLAPVRIDDGRASFRDARAGTRVAFSRMNLTLRLPTPQAPLRIDGDLLWRERPVKLSLFVRAPRRLPTAGSPVEAVVSAPDIEATWQGLVRLRNGMELAGRLQASGPSLRRLLAWIGNPPPTGRGLGPWALKGALSATGGDIGLKEARVRLDGMNARGRLRIRLGRARPFVSAALGVDRIDVNTYLAPPARTAPGGGATRGKAARLNTAAGDDWSDRPIDFAPLKVLDADLRLATNAILWREVKIGRSALSARLRDGRLEATLSRMALYGGTATGRIIIDGARRMPALSGALRARGLDGAALLADFADIRRIRGRLALELSLATAGRSQREMVSRLKGRARLEFRDGAIRGINIARLLRGVRRAILEGWHETPAEKTDFAELSATFRVTDGIAATDDLKLLGPLVRLTGAGEVDLLRRRLEMKVEPKLVATLKGQGGRMEAAGLPVPVIVRGPWAAPKIYPDIEGILKDPQAAYARLRALGEKLTGPGAAKKIDRLKEKATRELEKVIGGDRAGDAVDGAAKKAKKLLRGLRKP